MTEGSIFMSLVAGFLYGWASAYSTEEARPVKPLVLRHGFTNFFVLIIAILTITYSGINTGSFMNSLFSFLVVLFTGFTVNFITSRRITHKLSAPKASARVQRHTPEQEDLDAYAGKLLKLSANACKETALILNIKTNTHGDRWLLETISYSLFITSLHCQREKFTDSQVSAILSSLLIHIAFETTGPAGNDILEEQKALSDAYDHFHKYHVTRKSNAGELINSIVISLMSEYKTSKSEDVTALTKTYQAFTKLAKSLNDTGFASTQKH